MIQRIADDPDEDSLTYNVKGNPAQGGHLKQYTNSPHPVLHRHLRLAFRPKVPAPMETLVGLLPVALLGTKQRRGRHAKPQVQVAVVVVVVVVAVPPVAGVVVSISRLRLPTLCHFIRHDAAFIEVAR
jgi:hypothetical protein